jgi:hypothetical protein
MTVTYEAWRESDRHDLVLAVALAAWFRDVRVLVCTWGFPLGTVSPHVTRASELIEPEDLDEDPGSELVALVRRAVAPLDGQTAAETRAAGLVGPRYGFSRIPAASSITHRREGDITHSAPGVATCHATSPATVSKSI